jgi:hypothetical protein
MNSKEHLIQPKLLDSDAAAATPMLLDIHLGGIAASSYGGASPRLDPTSRVIFDRHRRRSRKAGFVAHLKKPSPRDLRFQKPAITIAE